VTRRDLLRLMSSGALLSACAAPNVSPKVGHDEPGRLDARPRNGHGGAIGLIPLGMSTPRDGFIYVPRAGTLPLLVMLHGATQSANRMIVKTRDFADKFGFIILAPDSRDTTWDVVRGEFGPDVDFIDRALDRVFTQYSIDSRRLGVGGFSDGASYALSLGITNGDLFTHVLAFSPGFAVPSERSGSPRIFISHGTEDEILPIDRTSRRMVPRLRAAGYTVEYVEFDGPHTLPSDVADRAFQWFMR
jgi:phospholipase/carboxylesterase